MTGRDFDLEREEGVFGYFIFEYNYAGCIKHLRKIETC